MDEFKLRKQSSRSEQAKRLLENELFKEAFIAQRDLILEIWEKSEKEPQEFRERLWYQYQGLLGAKEHLEHVIRTGKDADKKLMEQFGKPSLSKRTL